MKRRVVAAAMLPLLLLTIAYASVFVYYPMTINTIAVAPPIVFEEGSNAGEEDLGGNTIEVSISPQGTEITITLHPTYQETLYKDIALIRNLDTRAYNVYIRVLTPLDLPTGSSAVLEIRRSGGVLIASVDLLSTGTTFIGSLDAGDEWSIWVLYTIPEQSSPPDPTSAILRLIYTPSSETPP